MLPTPQVKDNAIVLTTAMDLLVEFSGVGSAAQSASINGWVVSNNGQPVQFGKDFNSGVSGAFASTQIPLPAGTLYGFVVSQVGSPTGFGTGFARVSLVPAGSSGGPRIMLLAEGYVTQGVFLGWPGQQPTSGGAVTQAQTLQQVNNPAAGNDWNFSTASLNVNPLQYVAFTLATSAVAGNRTVHLQVSDGIGFVIDIPGAVQTASQSIAYCFINGANAAGTTAGFQQIQMPSISLGRLYSVGTLTSGLLAGDQFSLIRLQGPWQAAV